MIEDLDLKLNKKKGTLPRINPEAQFTDKSIPYSKIQLKDKIKSTDVSGILATDTEAQGESATDKILTPSNIAGINTVAMAFQTSNPAQSINNSTETALNWNTTSVDTRDCFTTGTPGYFTAPESGNYMIIGGVLFANIATTADWLFYLRVLINDSPTIFLQRKEIEAGITQLVHLRGSGIINLNAGDTVKLAAFHTRGSALGLFADGSGHYHRFNIFKIH